MTEWSDNAKAVIAGDRFAAAVELVGRTGATSLQVRYHDDEEPVLWMVVALFDDHAEVGAGTDPITAAHRLCDALIDGGMCKHCHRPTGFYEEIDQLPMDDFVCWYQYDPELKKYRRGCEGD